MKQIISASYKEDIPAFGSEKFFQDVRKGHTFIPSKFGTRRISLLPEDVYCYVFWTKNPSRHFIASMMSLPSPFYIQWTVTPYPQDIETNLPPKDEVMRNFQEVSNLIGPDRVVWRYDPIFMGKATREHPAIDVDYHIRQFENMCAAFQGLTKKCVISFMDEYGKIRDLVRQGLLRAPSTDEIHRIAAAFGAIAPKYGITVQTCSEGQYDLSAYGIREAPCIDAEFIEKQFGIRLPESIKKPNSFRRCLCAINTDIGSYHQCKHGCIYCYAQ